tara:strand:+ start:449 stop:652 length:204 start_codon:yes stop_codon:yes gene_type:complete
MLDEYLSHRVEYNIDGDRNVLTGWIASTGKQHIKHSHVLLPMFNVLAMGDASNKSFYNGLLKMVLCT